MDKDKMIEYSQKYKKISYRISIGVFIFLLILGASFFGVGCWICLLRKGTFFSVVGTIMIVTGMLNVFLGIKFIKLTKENLKTMNDKLASEKYCKIMGIKY